jgi:hypothetical protein
MLHVTYNNNNNNNNNIIIIIIIITSNVLWNYLLRANFIHVKFVGQPQNLHVTMFLTVDSWSSHKDHYPLYPHIIFYMPVPSNSHALAFTAISNNPTAVWSKILPNAGLQHYHFNKICLEITSNLGGSPAVKANNEQIWHIVVSSNDAWVYTRT